MKHKSKKAIAVFLALLMVITTFSALPLTVSAADVTERSVGTASGTTGDCTWTLDDEGTLTISGNGAMADYSSGYGYSGYSNVVVEDGVTRIGKYAFSGCSSLTSVTIPESVTEIGNWAFSNCSSLTSITVDEDNPAYSSIDGNLYNKDATTMLQYAIGKTDTFFTIPDSVTSFLGEYYFRQTNSGLISFHHYCVGVFSGCTNLTSVTIPGSVKSIGATAFYNCTNLESVTIADTVERIDPGAFENCTSLTSVTIPSAVSDIGIYEFKNCSSLTNVSIPNSVTKIRNEAFEGCINLTSVMIPASVTSIEFQALGYYHDDSGTKKVDGFTILGYSGSAAEAYANENNFTFIALDETPPSSFKYKVLDDDTAEITGYTGSDINIVTPSIIDGHAVSSIGNSAFDLHQKLTRIILTDGITKIGNYAFYRCTNLTNITIPDSVTSIGYSAFEGCASLTSITISDSVTSIGESAFKGCKVLSSIIVDERNAKYDSRNNCNAIIETESNCLIQGCKNTVIPHSVTSIGQNAFNGCTNLTNISIPDSVTSIGHNAFEGCTSLTSITIPDSVTSIESRAFRACKELTSIAVDKNNAKYDSRNNCNAIIETESNRLIQGCKNTVIPHSVTCIGDSAFYRCSNLTTIAIPNSVKEIKEHAFAYSGLTKISIPNSVTRIESDTFYDCNSLTSITIPNSVTLISSNALDHNAFFEGNRLNVYYQGTKESWKKIWILPNNQKLTTATIHYISLGDVDLDGDISIRDVTEIQRHLVEIIELNDAQLAAADTNGDNDVDIGDATHLQRFIAHYFDEL